MSNKLRFGLFAAVAAFVVAGAAIISAGGAGTTAEAHGPLPRTYWVTLRNLTDGQPFSPGLAVTHRPSTHLFEVGSLADAGIEAIAESGNEAPAVAAAAARRHVTDVVDIDRPLTPQGTVVGSFTDTFVFEIMARPGDRLSLATMLICTNDGFTGLNGGRLPRRGEATYMLAGYDAGTEGNTEESADIVDPCSGLGPVPLAGDPNGNDDAGVDASPHVAIQHHPGILGGGDLSPAEHGWTGPVAMITIEAMD